ncbi:hypothetical protein [Filimonas effusa]|uniref:GLPGLI family protein n=1 Tax=Filimonas effusa TaxID=2508721 RepID=A0A4Q1D213_9BACT|nr:hypothetical protein [Filimonas effusa]RXK81340.1 hypothetical protein ESB13_20605 [Filimonas effusa]
MKKILIVCLFFITSVWSQAQNPKVVADCTVSFDVIIDGASKSPSTKTLYIRGVETRTDLVNSNFVQTTFYNSKTETAVILREIGGNKYMTTLSAEQWKAQNKRYEGMEVVLTDESKTILGYYCKKAQLKLKDGSTLNVYYATGITPSASENNYQFKGVPGFPLEYETAGENGKGNVKFTATRINLNPVPASRFEIPQSGYRIL